MSQKHHPHTQNLITRKSAAELRKYIYENTILYFILFSLQYCIWAKALSSLYRYVGLYKEDGLDSLLGDSYKGYWGRLDSFQISAFRKELNENLYTDAKSVANWIQQTFGIVYTPQGVVDLLNRIGFTYKATYRQWTR